MSDPGARLALDDPRWAELHHAFGTAEDVPRLLEHLSLVDESVRNELWIGLWHLLWRDGEAFGASLAALPHILDFAASLPAAERAVALHLASAICSARVGELDAAGESERAIAMRRIPALVLDCVDEPWARDTAQVLVASLAIAQGHAALGGAILALEAVTRCPVCGGAHPTSGWQEPGDSALARGPVTRES